MESDEQASDHSAADAVTRSTTDRYVVPVIQEELQVGKRVVDTGRGIRVHRQIVERTEVVDTPLREDVLEVRRVPVGRMVDRNAVPSLRQEGDTLIIPVLEEVLVIERQLRLKEELHITRHQREVHAPQTVVLKSQQVRIERFDEKAAPGGTPPPANEPKEDRIILASLPGNLLKESIMVHTLIGVYENYSQAQGALDALVASGFDRSDLELSPAESSAEARQATLSTASSAEGTEERSFGSGVRNFFNHMFGGSDEYREHADVYSEAIRRGHYLLTVHADDETESAQATQVMNRFSPVNIDERAAQWKSRGWSSYDETAPLMSDAEIEEEHRYYATGTAVPEASAATTGITTTGDADRTVAASSAAALADEQAAREREAATRTTATEAEVQRRERTVSGATEGATIPVIQEELQVGKRLVDRGGVRVYQHVRETPVDESVRLHEEHVHVERHAVNRPASEADLAGLKEGSFEMRETAEEAVIGKTARIVEEVVISKEGSDRTQEIHDTVRRTDVEVEQLGASASATSDLLSGDDEYRRHFQTAYANAGKFEDYAQAYRYGSTVAADERFRGHRWDEAEEDVHADWESRYGAATPWEKAKNAVRYGWERATR